MAIRYFILKSPLPPGFNGDAQAIAKAIMERLAVLTPEGELTQQIGGIQPLSNIGIWWKDGTKPYVWDDNAKTYIPADVSDSLDQAFWFGDTTPASTTPNIWLKWYPSKSRAQWWFYNPTTLTWESVTIAPRSGTTAQRPIDAIDYEQYFDTTINALIHWERGQWRTVDGVPGDVKFVSVNEANYAAEVAAALARNPGWIEAGTGWQGRALVIAGAGPGLTVRAPRETFGDEEVILAANEMPKHRHGLTTTSSPAGNLRLAAFASGSLAGYALSYNGAGGSAPTMIDATDQQTAYDKATDAEGHDNVPPSVALVALQKT
jgi:hypothetical protein